MNIVSTLGTHSSGDQPSGRYTSKEHTSKKHASGKSSGKSSAKLPNTSSGKSSSGKPVEKSPLDKHPKSKQGTYTKDEGVSTQHTIRSSKRLQNTVPHSFRTKLYQREALNVQQTALRSSPKREHNGVPMMQPLFTPLNAFTKEAFELLPQALDEVMPLSRAHRMDLPDAIRDLSKLLTTEREGLHRSYWASPRFVAAYLRYFLPWNLIRLARLLPSLDLPTPVKGSLIMDVGSGPLTWPLALWLSRPDYREVALRVVCTDTSPRPMALGHALIEALTKACGVELLWKIECRRVDIGKALREIRHPVTLFTAGNVLNEVKPRNDMTLMDRMGEMMGSVERVLAPEGRAVFVEPGTRFGGTLIATLRTAAKETELIACTPCTHSELCPLLGRKDRGWCHVVQDAGAPLWLASLAGQAKLPKDSLALSFMLFKFCEEASCKPSLASPKATHYGRVISDAFRVPGMGFSRYACTHEGLVLIGDASSLPSGAFVPLQALTPLRRDAKSGAIIVRWISSMMEK